MQIVSCLTIIVQLLCSKLTLHSRAPARRCSMTSIHILWFPFPGLDTVLFHRQRTINLKYNKSVNILFVKGTSISFLRRFIFTHFRYLSIIDYFIVGRMGFVIFIANII